MTISDIVERCFLSNELFIDVKPKCDNRPSVIGLFVTDIDDAAKGYFLLYEHFSNRKITLLIHPKHDTLDISLVIKNTADTINIKGLKYDKSHLENFINTGINDHGIVFVLASDKRAYGQISLLSIPEMISPILLDNYLVI